MAIAAVRPSVITCIVSLAFVAAFLLLAGALFIHPAETFVARYVMNAAGIAYVSMAVALLSHFVLGWTKTAGVAFVIGALCVFEFAALSINLREMQRPVLGFQLPTLYGFLFS